MKTQKIVGIVLVCSLLGSLGVNIALFRYAAQDVAAHDNEKTSMVCLDHTGQLTNGDDWMYCQTAHVRPLRGKDWHVE